MFVKGKSGNPSGRPKALHDVTALARKQTVRNIEVLVELRDHAEDNPTRMRAAIALHEIAWGKPTQAVQADVTHNASDSLLQVLEKIATNAANG